MFYSFEVDCSPFEGCIDSSLNVSHLECLQQTQNLHEFALPGFAHPRVDQTTRDDEGFAQFPTGQRCCLIQSIGLLFSQRQIMQRIEYIIHFLP